MIERCNFFMAISQHKKNRNLSLSSRYLLLAGMVIFLLVTGAILSNFHTNRVTQENIEALNLRDEVSNIISRVNQRVRDIDSALTSMLTLRDSDYKQKIEVGFNSINTSLDTLSRSSIMRGRYGIQLNEMNKHFNSFYLKIYELMEKRKDNNWNYPVLPYISKKLLEPNDAFELNANHALSEITEDDGEPYRSDLYGRFNNVRGLWRKKILEFRAVLIRFMALNQDAMESQERNVEILHEEIEKQLNELSAMQKNGKLGFDAENALQVMRTSSKLWHQNWLALKALRASTNWRRDIVFLNEEVVPVKQAALQSLTTLEQTVFKWSVNTTARVQGAATEVSYVVWGLCGLAIIFVLLVYYMINRMVLRPIMRMTDAIGETESISISVDKKSSREIFQLVTAFSSMRKQIHQRQLALEHQSLHDSLTGLPNRMLLQDRLEHAIQMMGRNKSSMALLILDLDRFKDVNDALGHQVGDRLLQHVAKRLAGIIRESDTVARLGGDEFAIVTPDVDVSQTKKFSKKIINQVNEVFQIENQNIYVGVSIGVAVYPENGHEAGQLIRNADIAMYHAKRNNFGFSLYDNSMSESGVDNLALVGDLHQELQEIKNLELYFQPQIDLMTRNVIGVEVLLRWHHPQLGPISPEHIISMAEHAGMIGQLTEWIIETALSEYVQAKLSHQNIHLSINLSAWNLQDPELPHSIEMLLNKYYVQPSWLMLEITETAMMSDPVRAREVLLELDTMGIGLSVDDYGTGFSSLGYLKMLPVKELKIDRSFVADMLDDENDAIIVRSTIDLAHNLGLKVVAEGVENQEVLLRLRTHKCDVAQGYNISKPLPIKKLMEWLESYHLKIAR